jgi:glycosyltransferase involved in cell wall biosynthesis
MTEPIRIARMIARLNVGGPAIHVALLTEKLAPPDYSSTLISGQVGPDEGDMRYYAEARGIAPVDLPGLGRELHPLRDLLTLWRAYRLLRRLRPHIVHTHTAKAGVIGRLAARLAGVPVVVHTYHGHVFHGYFSTAKTRFFLLLERLMNRLTDRAITLTDGLKHEIGTVYRAAPPDKIAVLGLGLDLSAFSAMPRRAGAFRAAHGISADAPLVGIVGRLVRIKNHALFLDAAAQIYTMNPAARFMIVGDGELRAELEARAAALGISDCVIFTGWLRDLAPVYSDLDALVISSDNEGTPVSVIEALASGCPVAATRVGGLAELLEDGALGALVPARDPAALAEAITAVLDDPPDMTAARTLMPARYGIERLAADLDALYRELLGRSENSF